jgi:predicted TIM-barrel fold metal-dependent hydrolase
VAIDYAPAFAPYMDSLRADVEGLELFDAHTHIGHNDPDGFKQSAAELTERLAQADARALVFPMHEPDGYLDGAANDEVLQAARDHPDRLVAFCRVDPNAGEPAVEEARRALDAGARGIKLHPRGEGFTLGHPIVERLVALAHERELPMLVHAGRGIPALGADTVRLTERFQQARIILAHAAISDLSWLWRVLPDHPNLFIDTAWWNPVDVVALYTQAPPGQVLWASDTPYGHPLISAVQGLRCAIQAGLTPEQVRGTAGAQLARMIDGEPLLDLGPAPLDPRPLDPTLDRVTAALCAAIGRVFARADASETVALARLACAVDDDDPVAPVCTDVLALLDRYETEMGPPPPSQPFPDSIRYLVGAVYVARTPVAHPGSPRG